MYALRAFVTAILVAAPLTASPSIAAETAAAAGKRIFERVGCYQCHGYAGQGGSAGLRLAPDPKPYEVIAQFVRGTTGAMPAYSEKILSDADLRSIYAYLQSVPKTQDVDKIPLLKSLK